METEGSIPWLQELTTGPYSEKNEPSVHPHTSFFKIHLNVILQAKMPYVFLISHTREPVLLHFIVSCTLISNCMGRRQKGK